ncbi:MAG: chemotaxis-specific protein-glutamate methyltransferase CheB [Candidatus Binatia bacterium]
MPKVRVLVADDSLTVRKKLWATLSADPEIEVIAEAEDGKRAIELCQALRPDVVTMDMMMPVMTGLAATEYIMAYCPTPILIVSASVNRGEVFKTYDALAAGAADVLEKPQADAPDGYWESRFITAVKLIARIRVITHPRARLKSLGRQRPAEAPSGADSTVNAACTVVALGASTGGPAALVEVLGSLPPDFPLPTLIVMHINDRFGAAFADWLDGQTTHQVSYAQDGEPLAGAAGRVVMAPPDRHLVVRDGRLRLTRDAERHSCRPSVDVLFESLARECGSAAAACLLTGMGRDGAAGLLDIRRAGGFTIAQDQASSVVYGMPREAVQLNAAVRVLPLADIGPTLTSLAGGRVR